MERLHGSCLCGGVRFEIEPPTRFCAHCHCSICRRAHGAPMVTWAGVPSAQLSVTEGEQLLERYASSPEARRSFCKRCGSQLFFESSRWPGEVHVAVASLTDELDRPVAVHVFFDDRVPWLEVADGLPRLGGESGVEPIEE